MAYLKTKPYTLNCDESKLHNAIGAQISVKATTEQTNGVFNLFEVSCPPGFATPLHIHYAEDVAVYVLEGALSFFWGNDKQEAAAGSYFFQPRGTPHGFCVEGHKTARILYMTSPAGFDRFVVDQERAATCSEVSMRAAQYKIEILGPLPG